ncbi:hypothetical protein Pcinc_019024 [Petrolisthes cinctipes]|uniref:Uncharacterized protein n=1 Tax=Petrolisthes cinctipes TaxID=88211 RepID=A0AAE1KKZ1_PETCI|nr:hypothetical protein Pcinc_019024 [Petrolisthes cinctipes]
MFPPPTLLFRLHPLLPSSSPPSSFPHQAYTIHPPTHLRIDTSTPPTHTSMTSLLSPFHPYSLPLPPSTDLPTGTPPTHLPYSHLLPHLSLSFQNYTTPSHTPGLPVPPMSTPQPRPGLWSTHSSPTSSPPALYIPLPYSSTPLSPLL